MNVSALFSLRGRRALVTGASAGLGLQMARALAAAGAEVNLNGRDAARLERARAEVEAGRDPGGVPVRVLAFDVTDRGAVAAAMAQLETQGGLDILVNNVGQRQRQRLADFTPEQLGAHLDVNLVAPFFLCQQAAPLLARSTQARVINITSIAGPIARAGDAAYTTAKGGLMALTRALAAELGPCGVTVNAIAPGYFATETNAAMVADPEIAQWLAQRSALGRWGRPEEIGGAAVFLASAAGSYVTGHMLAVDGGYLAHF